MTEELNFKFCLIFVNLNTYILRYYCHNSSTSIIFVSISIPRQMILGKSWTAFSCIGTVQLSPTYSWRTSPHIYTDFWGFIPAQSLVSSVALNSDPCLFTSAELQNLISRQRAGLLWGSPHAPFCQVLHSYAIFLHCLNTILSSHILPSFPIIYRGWASLKQIILSWSTT